MNASEQLMNEDEIYLPELDDIELDVVLAAAVDLELDIMDFCISQLEVKEAVTDDMSVEEDEFLVSLHHFTKVKGLTYQLWMWPQILDDKTADEEEDTVNDKHSTEQSSGNVDQSPRVQYLLIDNKDHSWPVQSQKDIIEIVSRCLKEAKKLKSAHTVKIMTQLTTDAEYVKLHAYYLANNHTKKPAQTQVLQ